MVTLVRMTQPELDEYLKTAIQTLADELMRANNWSADQSMSASLQSFNSLLPGRRVDSPNQSLRTIVADGNKVGSLWFGVRGKNESFLYDILIFPSCRNKGYGQAAMRAMEDELRKMGITSVALNVFAHNSTASEMYRKLGYTPVAIKMIKRLS